MHFPSSCQISEAILNANAVPTCSKGLLRHPNFIGIPRNDVISFFCLSYLLLVCYHIQHLAELLTYVFKMRTLFKTCFFKQRNTGKIITGNNTYQVFQANFPCNVFQVLQCCFSDAFAGKVWFQINGDLGCAVVCWSKQ
jgi:hypothetical protein